jgi:maleylpyruvate isomerase
LVVTGFFIIFNSNWGKDEPQTLRYAITPNCSVGGDGGQHPAPPLLPSDPMGRAHVRAMAQIIVCDVHPLQNLRVLDHLRSQFGADQAALDLWCRRWIGDGLAACEALVAGSTAFCFGDSPTVADICLIPQMFSAGRFGLDLATFPKLRAIFDHAITLEAFAKAAPAAQPDAE